MKIYYCAYHLPTQTKHWRVMDADKPLWARLPGVATMSDYPTIKDLTTCLRDIQQTTDWTWLDANSEGQTEDDPLCLDVRLQVIPDEGWALHTGDPGYDTDHHGYWGAGLVSQTDTMADLRALAKALIDETKDAAAMDEQEA